MYNCFLISNKWRNSVGIFKLLKKCFQLLQKCFKECCFYKKMSFEKLMHYFVLSVLFSLVLQICIFTLVFPVQLAIISYVLFDWERRICLEVEHSVALKYMFHFLSWKPWDFLSPKLSEDDLPSSCPSTHFN